MIKQVQIKNFRCFRDVTVDLEPFTVLIGKNDTGKSTLLEALDRCLRAPSHSPNFDDEMWQQRVRAGQPMESLSVQIRLDSDCSIALQKGLAATLGPKLPKQEAAVRFAKRLIRSPMPPYRLHAENLRSSSQVGGAFTSKPLDPVGKGLAAVLDRILSEDREVFDMIEEGLKQRLPAIKRLRLRPQREGNSNKIVGFDLRGGAKLDARQVSDGVMLVLAFLTIAHDEHAPSLLMVEEPENGIHPKQLREVLVLLRALTGRERNPIQVILTTHSPYVLDFVPQESVRVFRRDAESGDVEVLPFAETKEIKALLEGGFTLGEAWYNADEDELQAPKETQDAGSRS
jgi:predicted ATPase